MQPTDKDSSVSLRWGRRQVADKHAIGINDALAYETMKGNTIHEIYSNDKHFDNLPEITRILR